MKSLFEKRIIDERMELQSLKNAKKSWNFLLLATGLCFLIEIYVLNWSFYYVVPQWIVLMTAAIYNLFLDVKDGNIFTAEAANRKSIFILYVVSALVTGVFVGYGFYSRHHWSAAKSLFLGIFTFLLVCGLIYLLDHILYRIGKKRIEKREEETEDEDATR